ncbi:piggyBac transposable element-derived protein 4-like [Neodiprion pinetum]|uniref:piggyBac transposable element-derived protein 4-like n=1 Tax=Neodiprion pinetum TaxID=441929 RepID=UPI0037190673
MTQRNLEQIQSLLRGLPLGTSYEILSQDEPNNEEAFHEVDDIQDADEDTAQGPSHGQLVIRGRNNYRWYTNNSEIPVQHVSQIYFAKPNGDAMNIRTPLEAWSLLFPNDLLEIIVRHTNEEIRRRAEYQNEDLHRETNLVELKALLGLLYFTGLEKQNASSTEDLWTPLSRYNMYEAAMDRHRFYFLLACLTFDDKATRIERQRAHQLAPIKEIWELFIWNCMRNYFPSSYCTIDQHFLKFEGRFCSKVFIPNKPKKSGIKIVCMNDVQTSYLINAEPYAGRIRTLPGESVTSYYVRKLSESIHHTGRNITCDNWFMSVDLVRKMKIQYNLSMVGTLRKNTWDIPSSFTRNATPGTVRFGYNEGNTLVSYCPESKKVLILLSSLHKTGRVTNDTGSPEILDFYNRTKEVSDRFDQMCQTCNSARHTSMWPLRMFYGMLDYAAVNSFVLYNLQSSSIETSQTNFNKALTDALIQPHLRARLK